MIALLSLLFQIAKIVLGIIQERQLLDAGRAEVIKENLNASVDALTKANKARADAIAKHRATGGVSDKDDPNRRD